MIHRALIPKHLRWSLLHSDLDRDILREERESVQGTLKTSRQCENVPLTAEELTNLELLIDTTRPLTFVVPQSDCESPPEELQVYAPM